MEAWQLLTDRVFNLGALDESLRAAFGDEITGLSWQKAIADADRVVPASLTVLWQRKPIDKQLADAQAIIDAHDPRVPSTEESLRLQDEAAKEDFVKAAPVDAAKVTLQDLAARVAKLEEIVKTLIP